MELYFESAIEFSHFNYLIYVFSILLALLSYRKVKTAYDDNLLKFINVKYSFIVAVVIIYLCIKLITLFGVSQDYKSITNGNLKVVEGPIENYKSEKIASREESFRVGNIEFNYNDTVTPSYFFANRNRKDSVIANGILVKISYLDKADTRYIVKLEVSEHK